MSHGDRRHRLTARLAISGLIVSAAGLIVAPQLMPESYSWLSNTTSESAAQGVSWAALARASFVVFGSSVLLLCSLCRERWGGIATACHLVFGLSMIAAALFSTRSWIDGAPYDELEDLLHSVSASVIGFAFAGGVAAAAIFAARRSLARRRALDFAALAASALLPLAMVAQPESDGLLQRLMFAVAYLWYGVEAATTLTPAQVARRR